jgi:hypothetical protein
MSAPTPDRWRSRTTLAAAVVAAFGVTAGVFACSPGGDSGSAASGTGASPTVSPTATPPPTGIATPAGTLSCAVNGSAALTTSCTAERVVVAGSPVLVIRHPDGGFRRFDVLAGGTLAETDGAIRAAVVRTGTTLDVTVGADRYRLDVSVLGNAP